jgi:hypothetical protein
MRRGGAWRWAPARFCCVRVPISFDYALNPRTAIVVVLAALGCGGLAGPAPGPTPLQSRTPVVSGPPATGAPGLWRPAIGAAWQWQLGGLPLDLTVEAEVYDVDLFETSADEVAALRAAGRRAICYLSAGSWEDWRPDAGAFPAGVLGADYAGWPGERWLDIRRLDMLAPILRARLDLCAAKGFDAVEPDNVDGHLNATGFPLTADDQLNFNLWLAGEAHARGLSIGLKNVPEQAQRLEPYFDWALTEDCFAEGWCEAMLPFILAGKAVLAAEYTDTGVDWERACAEAARLGISVILKDRELGAERETCP